jgi:hypothetical protein
MRRERRSAKRKANGLGSGQSLITDLLCRSVLLDDDQFSF